MIATMMGFVNKIDKKVLQSIIANKQFHYLMSRVYT